MHFSQFGPGGDLPWRTLLRAVCTAAMASPVPARVLSTSAAAVTELMHTPSPQPPQQQHQPESVRSPPSVRHLHQPPPEEMERLAAAAAAFGSTLTPEELAEHYSLELEAREAHAAASAAATSAAPPSLTPPQQQPQSTFRRPPPPPPLDVDALLDAALTSCRSLREALLFERQMSNAPAAAGPGGDEWGGWTLPPRAWGGGVSGGDTLEKLCESTARSALTLRCLVAGHLGCSSWSPARHGGLLGGDAQPSGRAAVWASVCADAEALLRTAGYPGFAARNAIPEEEEDASPTAQSVRFLAQQLGDTTPFTAAAAPPSEWVEILLPSNNPYAPPNETLSVRLPASAVRHSDSPAGSARSSFTAAEKGCALCFERPVEAALLECGHAVSCFQCAQALTARGAACPVCRSPIARVLRVFL